MLEFPPEIASTIPAEHLSHEAIQRYNSPADLIKGHLELQEYRGRSIALPKADSKPEDVAKWRTETGEKLKGHGFTVSALTEQPPEKPDGYDFKVEGVDPELVKSDAVVQAFRPWAHKNGINNATANAMIQFYAKEVVPMLAKKFNEAQGEPVDMIEDAERTDKMLAERFKDDISQRREQAENAIKQMAMDIPDLNDALEGYAPAGNGAFMPLKNHPAIIAAFALLGEKLQQDFGGHVNGSTMTLDAVAASEADAIRTDPTNGKYKLYHSNDPHTVEYVNNLYKKAYGDKEVVANEFLPKIIDRTGTRG